MASFCMYYYYNLLRRYSRGYTDGIMCHYVWRIAIASILINGPTVVMALFVVL